MGKRNRHLGSGYITRVSRERCVLASSYLPVCLSMYVCMYVCINTSPTGRLFLKSDMSVEKLQIQLQSDKIISHMNTQVCFILLTATCFVLP